MDDKALTAHFEAVSERYRGDSSDSDWQSIPETELQQNELTAMFRR